MKTGVTGYQQPQFDCEGNKACVSGISVAYGMNGNCLSTIVRSKGFL